MNKKNYPQIVMVKKSLIWIAAIGIILILGIIVINLFNARQTPQAAKPTAGSTLEIMANQSDRRWYSDKQPKTNNSTKQKVQSVTVMPRQAENISMPENSTLAPTNNEDEIAKQEIIKAMSAPINSNQLTGEAVNQNPNTVVNEDRTVTTQLDQNHQDSKKIFLQENNHSNEDYLHSLVKDPISPYELKTTAIIPAELITGINSDLPGTVTAQVRSNVYDSVSGNYLLIPQGAKLEGVYDSEVVYGQKRVLLVWNRIIFPNGQSINLEGMPGIDLRGYAGFKDKVDNHYLKMFGSVLLMSTVQAGAQLSQPQNNNNSFANPTIGQVVAQSLGTNISDVANQMTAKNLNIQPTLKIRPGYKFNIKVTKDIVFPSPYLGD